LTPPWYDWRMATTKKTDADVIARLAGKGEQAIQRLADLPGGTSALKAFNDVRHRVDDLSKRMRGVDELEKRVAKLEREVAGLRRAQKPAVSQKAPARKSS
jgi:phage shock protein A